MKGLEAQNDAFWEEWTPRIPASPSVDERLRPATVFDAWRVEDSEFRQPVWDATFHMVNTLELRGVGDSAGLRSLLLRLDPSAESVHWEVAFVSQQEGDFEGVVVRMAGEDGAGIWIEASRPAGGTSTPTRWTFRAEPAAEEIRGTTVWWEKNGEENAWQGTVGAGADADRAQSALADDAGWVELLQLWEKAIWAAVSDREYLEPEFERIEGVTDPIGPGWPASLGISVEERGLRDFVDDTVFAPRTTDATPEYFDERS